MWLSKYGRQWVATPLNYLVDHLHAWGVTPNMVTYAGFIFTVFTAVILARGNFLASGILLLFASLLDLVDGSLARRTKQSSTFGAFLDSTLDRYSEAVVFLALLYHYTSMPGMQWGIMLVFLTVVGSLMVSYTRARAEALNIECKEGWLQRPERIALLIIGLLTGLMIPVLVIMALLTNFTAVQRIYQVYWKIEENEHARVLLTPKDN